MEHLRTLRDHLFSSSRLNVIGRERLILLYPILLCLTAIPLGHILGIPTPNLFYDIRPVGVSTILWNVVLILLTALIISVIFLILDVIRRPDPPSTIRRAELPIYLRPADGTSLAWLDWITILLGIVALVIAAMGRLLDPPLTALCIVAVVTGVVSLITGKKLNRSS